jgi:hypothetical protein
MIQDPNSGHTIQLGGNMLPIPIGLRKVLLFLKKTSAEDLNAMAAGKGAGVDVRNQIEVGLDQTHHGLNQRGGHQRTVGTDPNDPIRMGGLGDVPKTGPDIFKATPMQPPSTCPGEFSHGIILACVTGGQDHVLPPTSLPNGLKDVG